MEKAPPAPARKSRPTSAKRDDLKLIKGVGPKIEKQLNSAGVYTFDQMSKLTTADLQAILGISKHVEQKANNLISQAKKFARA
jgi:predicted flap endonuclease-1-like 5' DNA nuclease